MRLAQGHIAVSPVKLEPAAPRSRDKHSTTEPLHSLICCITYRKCTKYEICAKLHRFRILYFRIPLNNKDR